MSEPTRLPVLFLSDVVLLPGMVVPIELDEARPGRRRRRPQRAAAAQLLVAPRLEDRYASYGVVATIEKVGRFRGGAPAAPYSVLESACPIGSGVTGPGAALWVEADPRRRRPRPANAPSSSPTDYKKLVVAVLQRREAWQIVDPFISITDPAAIADTAGYAPYLSVDRKRELLETPAIEARLELLIGWTQDYLAEVEVNDKIGEDVRESVEKNQREFLLRQQLAAIRKELGEGEPEGSRRLPRPGRGRRRARRRPRRARCARSTGSSAPATRAPRPRGSAPGSTPCSTCPGRSRTEDATDIDAARAVLDADHHGLEDVKDRIVEYLAVRARRARARPPGRRWSWLRRGDPARRPSRRRQDLARGVGRALARPEVRPGLPRRGPRRGRDPRPPSDLRRRAARPHRAGDQGGRLDEPRRAARRGRQGRLRLPRRPRRGAARGARPGAEPHLPRPLPRARPRPLRRALHRHRQRASTPSRRRCWTGWSWSRSMATPRTTRSRSLATSCCRASWSALRCPRTRSSVADEALREMAANYTREAGVRQLERLIAKALRKVATRLAAGSERRRWSSTSTTSRTWSVAPGSPRRRTSAPPSRASRQVSPSPASVVTCSSSRRARSRRHVAARP